MADALLIMSYVQAEMYVISRRHNNLPTPSFIRSYKMLYKLVHYEQSFHDLVQPCFYLAQPCFLYELADYSYELATVRTAQVQL